MKSLLIIAESTAEQEMLLGFLNQLAGTQILVAGNERDAGHLLNDQAADLLLCSLPANGRIEPEHLAGLTSRFPYIPAIVLTDRTDPPLSDLAQFGIGQCLPLPVERDQLRGCVREMLSQAISGSIRDIPLYSILQMLESEGKTCTLKVHGDEGVGFIFIDKGTVVGAETGVLGDEEAIYDIIAWQDPLIEIRYFNGRGRQRIDKPLISLIMEAFRRKDERDNLISGGGSGNEPKREQRFISTVGNRMSLEIGAKLKMEFDELESPLMSVMVGMVPERYLIVTAPAPGPVITKALERQRHITVKYIHMGRLCMFRTWVQKSIDAPYRLLFLEYPSAIHYHELRRSKRATIFVPCTFTAQDSPEYYGVLVDISSLGCQVRIKAKGNGPLPNVSLEEKVRLRCLLPGIKDDQKIEGVVKNIQKSQEQTSIGLEFIDLPDYLRQAIDTYLYSVDNIPQ